MHKFKQYESLDAQHLACALQYDMATAQAWEKERTRLWAEAPTEESEDYLIITPTD